MVKHVIVALITVVTVGCGVGDAMAHGAVVLPPAGLTPSNVFYFLDQLGETFQEFFAFTPQAKVDLQLSLAAERISELDLEVATHGSAAKGLEVARRRLANHIEKANSIISIEAEAGRDVQQLSEDFDEDLKELLQFAEEGSDGLLSEIEEMEKLLLE